MRKYSVILLVLLGAIVVAAGSVELLREAGAITFSLKLFAPLLIVILGLWLWPAPSNAKRHTISRVRKS
jgi:hypothetical protein